MTTSIKNYTNTFNIRGKEIEITAPARFDDATQKVVPDMKLDNAAVKMAHKNIVKCSILLNLKKLKHYDKSGI
ncbi:hypothetical protein IMAU10142_00522 [Lactobacillus helveticus]|uniref:hypothetical protein n=1 Tax=Lactobacillus helveticus TaxID=1587 RepID=UPI0015676379|nr:hypothetical protein [Lactobacillus helveticus]NRO90506.1 hypothetical protein [Lactobacillus helveticus]